jgi:phytol kinase
MARDSGAMKDARMNLESSNAPTPSRIALPDDPMAVHSSRKVYFAHLEADPYGFNDVAYDWPQDTRFALATAAFYATVLCGVLGMVRAGILPTFNPESLGYFAGALVLLFVGKCFFSWLVLHFRIKINYVRKLGLRPWKKLAAFVVPIVITQGSTVLTDWIVLFALGALVGLATESYWMRSRVKLFAYAYVSWDRIEDRPYSMRYDQIEDLFRFAIYLPFMILFGESSLIVLIPNLVNEFGDGLAEPVGIRFGKHTYRARAIWYDGRFWSGNFVRSIEGSATVFVVSLLILSFYSASFTPTQYIVTLAVLPLLMTTAEAISPHTGDGPMLALVGCAFLWAVQFL